MGFIIDTNIKGLGLERRKESFYVYDTEEEDNIFAFGDKLQKNPTLEISKEFLGKMVEYFKQNPNELEYIELD